VNTAFGAFEEEVSIERSYGRREVGKQRQNTWSLTDAINASGRGEIKTFRLFKNLWRSISFFSSESVGKFEIVVVGMVEGNSKYYGNELGGHDSDPAGSSSQPCPERKVLEVMKMS
jgi:hypothetical protein